MYFLTLYFSLFAFLYLSFFLHSSFEILVECHTLLGIWTLREKAPFIFVLTRRYKRFVVMTDVIYEQNV